MTDNVQGDFKEVTSALEELGIQIYEILQPAPRGIIQSVTELVQWLQNLSPQAKTMIVIITGLVAAIGPLLIILGFMAQGLGTILTVVGQVIGIFTKLLTGIKALGAAIAGLSPPVLIVIAVIAALIAIGVALYKNWDTIKEKAKETWENIKEAWENLKAKTTEVFQNVKQSISDAWQNAKQKTQEFLNNIRQSWENLK